MVRLVDRWVRSTHLGRCTLELDRHWMENVTLAHDWTPFREVMHLHSTLGAVLFTLDIELMDDGIMHYDAFMMIVACLPLWHHFDDGT
jgi:hypothetical protein